MHEIERKFLLNRPARRILAEARLKGTLVESFTIEQRYLGDAGRWTLRCRRIIREHSTTCMLTMKRKVSDLKSVELETVVDCDFFERMSALCGPTLRKTRHLVRHGEHIWEIDVFENSELEGLELAEIELGSEDETFDLPDWAGKDVTHRKRFKNARLVEKLAA